MRDAERWWVVVVGVVGLLSLAGGSLLSAVPRVDRPIDEVLASLAGRRSATLAGAVLSVTGSALLLWPIAAVATSSAEAWPSLAAASVGVAVLGFGFLGFASLATATLAWRPPTAIDPVAARLLFDAAHLATWSVSAPIGACSVVATTVVGVQGDVLGPVVVGLAAAKVVSVLVELAGTGRLEGANAGGWARGVSGYLTVAWFAAVLAGLA